MILYARELSARDHDSRVLADSECNVKSTYPHLREADSYIAAVSALGCPDFTQTWDNYSGCRILISSKFLRI